MFPFYIPWKHQKTIFLVFSVVQYRNIGQEYLKCILIPYIAQKWEVTLRVPLPNRVETWQLSSINDSNFSGYKCLKILVKLAKLKTNKTFLKIQFAKKLQKTHILSLPPPSPLPPPKKKTPNVNRSQNFSAKKEQTCKFMCEYISKHNWITGMSLDSC